MHLLPFFFIYNLCHFTDIEKKHQDDTDDDSGMGPSTFTDTASTTFSEVSHYFSILVVLSGHLCTYLPSSALCQDFMDKKMKEVDYDLKVQGLIETASSRKSWSGLEIHHAAAKQQLKDVRFLVEKKHCNPMQRDPVGFAHLHACGSHHRKCRGVQIFCHCMNVTATQPIQAPLA